MPLDRYCSEKTLERKVTLKFTAKKLNCFQDQLTKFQAENAMAPGKMHVYDEAQFFQNHVDMSDKESGKSIAEEQFYGP
uniref:Uncharacterized protein n=1 Tax=Oryza sativa subsp. japonica TaxID=39947 RepID=Q6Z9N0_ORYSJ|nr:hypothetical protein [Oryza sativa Japonica Group]BAD12979.1 hypothetical protein [Oryza sativa Japonica Group]